MGFVLGEGGWKESGREKRTRETTKGEKHKSVKTIFLSDVLLNMEQTYFASRSPTGLNLFKLLIISK